MGLSPRLRGNHEVLYGHHTGRGSIPAPTGKPKRRGRSALGPRVYPRAYGETAAYTSRPPSIGGLSPRLRGNPFAKLFLKAVLRSIPAPTGKPRSTTPSPGSAWVYPRAYGETAAINEALESGDGLSPRLRGNPTPTGPRDPWRRSIPAPTGKP